MKPSPRYDPYQHADDLGVTIIYHDLPAGENGRWYNGRRLVVIQPGMPATLERCVLAHELGHEHYGHLTSNRKSELQADRYAAENLIDERDLRRLVARSHDEVFLCGEFGVTVRLLRVRMYDLGLIPLMDVEQVDELAARRSAARQRRGEVLTDLGHRFASGR